MRYAPARDFPRYAFLPGRDPHPTRDPEGHSHGAEERAPPWIESRGWRGNEDYLHGVDLYNHGFLWEAHEAWEGLWHASRADPLQAEFLQGLIQCAAACLKVPMGQPGGLERLSALGLGRLERVAREGSDPYMGLAIAPFCESMRAFRASRPADIEGRPRIALVL